MNASRYGNRDPVHVDGNASLCGPRLLVLWVVEALVDEGRTMKRFRPRAQGRGFRILKRSSHISVAVSDVKASSKTMNAKKTTVKGATK